MTWEKQRKQLGQITRRYRRLVRAKNGPMGFHYELFFRLGWKTYVYTSPHASAWGDTWFPDPTVCLSTQPFSISKVSFLLVTLVLQLLILESVLRARPL
jgi:hypothetical protein